MSTLPADIKWREIDMTIDPKKKYRKRELEDIADALLAKDSSLELCPDCAQKEITEPDDLDKRCPDGHEWEKGESQRRGISGQDPYLNRGAAKIRVKREIYVAAGTPDPSVHSGIYGRPYREQRQKSENKEQLDGG